MIFTLSKMHFQNNIFLQYKVRYEHDEREKVTWWVIISPVSQTLWKALKASGDGIWS